MKKTRTGNIEEVKLEWCLDDLLPADQFDALSAEFEQELEHFSEWYDRLNPDINEGTFKGYIDFSERVQVMFRKLNAIGDLLLDEDITSSRAKQMRVKAADLGVKYVNATIKINNWLKGMEVDGKQTLDDDNAHRLFSSVPDLEFVLDSARSKRKYTLSVDIESVITIKDTTGNFPLLTLRKQIEADQRYFFKPNNERRGKTIKTKSELFRYVRSHVPEEREAAFSALFEQYQRNKEVYFTIFQAVVKDWTNEAKLRGYSSPISVRNKHNDLPDKAVEALLKVCTDKDNAGIFQRYFKFKARELGMARLRRVDIYAPLDNTEDIRVPFQHALELVLSTFNKFSPRFYENATKIVNSRHIDSHPNPNKKGGAFCYTVTSDLCPYVFLNYVGNEDSLFTLAHELGHGVHAVYADHLPSLSQHPGLAICETASTLAEMIVFEKLFEQSDDKKRKSMLAAKLSDDYATVIRQTYVTMFEVSAHRAIANGATLDEIENLWYDGLKEQFGDSVDVDPMFKNEWAYLTHMVEAPFYCYSYAFGSLLSLSLYRMYKEHGSSFVPRIEHILEAGGSVDPQKLLREVGIDINSSEFWQNGFNLIGEMQELLEGYS